MYIDSHHTIDVYCFFTDEACAGDSAEVLDKEQQTTDMCAAYLCMRAPEQRNPDWLLVSYAARKHPSGRGCIHCCAEYGR